MPRDFEKWTTLEGRNSLKTKYANVISFWFENSLRMFSIVSVEYSGGLGNGKIFCCNMDRAFKMGGNFVENDSEMTVSKTSKLTMS